MNMMNKAERINLCSLYNFTGGLGPRQRLELCIEGVTGFAAPRMIWPLVLITSIVMPLDHCAKAKLLLRQIISSQVLISSSFIINSRMLWGVPSNLNGR